MDRFTQKACDEIDASIFSGDTFHDQRAITEMEEYLARWTRGLAEIKTLLQNED